MTYTKKSTKGLEKLSARQIVRKAIKGGLDNYELSQDQEYVIDTLKRNYNASGLGPRKFVDCWDWGFSPSYLERIF